jgi:hypothetical protein
MNLVSFGNNMTRNEAEKLSRLFLKIGGDLNQSIAFVQHHDSEEEFIQYRQVAGKLMGDLYLDAMEPLWKRFPDLRPDDMGGPYKLSEDVYEPFFYKITDSDRNN